MIPSRRPMPKGGWRWDDGERIERVQAWHRKARVRLPNAKVHAVLHTVVETQIAMKLPAVTGAMARLMAEGLDRHEAVHAVGSVLITHIADLLADKTAGGDPNEKYYAELDQLTAESWRRAYD